MLRPHLESLPSPQSMEILDILLNPAKVLLNLPCQLLATLISLPPIPFALMQTSIMLYNHGFLKVV